MSLLKEKLVYRLFITPRMCNNNGIGDYKPCEYIHEAWDVYASNLGDKRAEICVLIHELVEHVLTDFRGIDEPTIAEFDRNFENRKSRGEVSANTEPGDDKSAPYYNEHRVATTIEMMIAHELGLTSEKYDNIIDSFYKNMR